VDLDLRFMGSISLLTSTTSLEENFHPHELVLSTHTQRLSGNTILGDYQLLFF